MGEVSKQIEEEFRPPVREKWDVESILSLRTNHENHPSLIKIEKKPKIRLGKLGIPLDVLKGRNSSSKPGLAAVMEEDEEDNENDENIEEEIDDENVEVEN